MALHCASAPEHTHCTDTTLNLCKSTDVDCFAPGAPQFGLTKSLTASLAGAIFCHHELGGWACQPP